MRLRLQGEVVRIGVCVGGHLSWWRAGMETAASLSAPINPLPHGPAALWPPLMPAASRPVPHPVPGRPRLLSSARPTALP